MKLAPHFPPLLKGHRVPSGKNPVAQAIGMLKTRKVGAGDILWSEDQDDLRFTLILEPEVERPRCGEMLFMSMVAFGDALGAISNPEIAINYRWPSTILLNEASIGTVDLILSDEERDGCPLWMLLNLEIAIRTGQHELEPGLNSNKTTIWDEGCGDISRTEILESVSRHIVNWIHTWSEDGFKQIHEQWMGRISEKDKIEANLTEGEFVGLDEQGNALIKLNDNISAFQTLGALATLRDRSSDLP